VTEDRNDGIRDASALTRSGGVGRAHSFNEVSVFSRPLRSGI
jgi:hypothetical protein